MLSLALWDLSRSNKHYIHLSSKATIYLASFLECPHLHQSRFPILILYALYIVNRQLKREYV